MKRNIHNPGKEIILYDISDAGRLHPKRFTISECIGEGAGCVAYRAAGASGIPFKLKQFIPRNAEAGSKAYRIAERRFLDAFSQQTELLRSGGTANITTSVFTLYRDEDGSPWTCANDVYGRTFDRLLPENTLPENLKTVRRVAESVKAFHEGLESVGFVGLYPNQPYCGLILHCAAMEDPVNALREYIGGKVSAESNTIIRGRLKKAYPGADDSKLRSAASKINGNLFLTEMVCRNSGIIGLDEITGDPEDVAGIIYRNSGFTAVEKALLKRVTLIPPEGIDRQLFAELFGGCLAETARLVSAGWLTEGTKTVSMDYRCRGAVFDSDLTDFPKWSNCSDFADVLLQKYEDCTDAPKRKQLRGMLKRASHLDGIPADRKKEIALRIKE